MTTVDTKTGLLLYGLVPADVEPTDDATGVGNPPTPVGVVAHGDIAALVSEVPVDRPLGRPDDLRAYKDLLDRVTGVAPVLPVRFGTVARDEAAVAELLGARHDDYRRALDRVEGCAQYVVRARYDEPVVLAEALAGNAEAAALRDRLRGQPEDALRDERIRLGELLNAEVSARRDADTQRLATELEPFCVAQSLRSPTSELDAAHLAVLVKVDREADFEGMVQRIAADWDERASVKLLGPLAPYDFVDQLMNGA
ncbi:GvpL/GvpF family gas vesicle protein [Plantactinospora siamensis]|uniref:GvpL/GvpF family gas vesicle protein n=1 Tax=Plantactinospora siamensis TaxID=555372 RepID=A0ABV6NXI2_9ACTN